MKNWEYSDDPADPCGYCVVWIESEDPVKAAIGEDAIPILPDGPVARLYRFVHDDCQAAVIAYSSESRGW